MKQHPLEMRSIPGYSRRVHAGAFSRAVETVMNFDKVGMAEATRRLMRDLEAGNLRLQVQGPHAAYLHTR